LSLVSSNEDGVLYADHLTSRCRDTIFANKRYDPLAGLEYIDAGISCAATITVA